jgi:hypothetical protein
MQLYRELTSDFHPNDPVAKQISHLSVLLEYCPDRLDSIVPIN